MNMQSCEMRRRSNVLVCCQPADLGDHMIEFGYTNTTRNLYEILDLALLNFISRKRIPCASWLLVSFLYIIIVKFNL